MVYPVSITTNRWETSTSYGAKTVVTYTMKCMETSTPTSLNMERKEMTIKKDVKEPSQEETNGNDATDVTDLMLKEYPTLMNSVKTHMNVCFKLMARKQRMYGMGNIGMNGNQKLALLGIAIRLNDKIQRLLNMIDKDLDDNEESLIDTAQDITNYGAILNTVLKDEWKK